MREYQYSYDSHEYSHDSFAAYVKLANVQSAFTLIELMIVLAIVGILLGIALPQYQHYIVRTKVIEGFHIATAAKLAVAEYYQTNNQYPASNIDAGLPANINSRYVASVSISQNGLVTIIYKSSVGAGDNSNITLAPTDENGVITWICSGTMPNEYRPSSCR